MESISEDEEAVLFAMQTAIKQVWPMSPPALFGFLPAILQKKWHTEYLAKVVLQNLEREGYIKATMVAPGVLHYSLTARGTRSLQPLAANSGV